MSPKVSDTHKETRRKAILEAAMRVFMQKGYESATMKDVVEESGMSRGGVYLYFSSTEEMMLAIQEQLDEENEDQLEQALAASGGSVWRTMELLMDQGRKDVERASQSFAPAIYEFYLSGYRTGKYTDLLSRRYEASLRMNEALIRKGIECGELNPLAAPEVISRLVVSIMDGMMLDCTLLGPERTRLREQMEASRMLMRHLLQVQEPPAPPSLKEE